MIGSTTLDCCGDNFLGKFICIIFQLLLDFLDLHGHFVRTVVFDGVDQIKLCLFRAEAGDFFQHLQLALFQGCYFLLLLFNGSDLSVERIRLLLDCICFAVERFLLLLKAMFLLFQLGTALLLFPFNTMIGEVQATGATYYEYIDTPEVGTYYYQVRADYGDCESDPAPAFDNPSNNYVMVEVALGLGENGGMSIYPNPTSGNVTIEAAGMQHITVVSVLGQVVYDADVDTDHCVLNMSQYVAGMYTVRVMTENGVRVERVTVVR